MSTIIATAEAKLWEEVRKPEWAPLKSDSNGAKQNANDVRGDISKYVCALACGYLSLFIPVVVLSSLPPPALSGWA